MLHKSCIYIQHSFKIDLHELASCWNFSIGISWKLILPTVLVSLGETGANVERAMKSNLGRVGEKPAPTLISKDESSVHTA